MRSFRMNIGILKVDAFICEMWRFLLFFIFSFSLSFLKPFLGESAHYTDERSDGKLPSFIRLANLGPFRWF